MYSYFFLSVKTFLQLDRSLSLSLSMPCHSSRNFYIHSETLRVYHVKIVKPKPENGDGRNMLLVRVSSFVRHSRRELRGFITDMEY